MQKDVERELDALPDTEKEAARTKFAVFVVHNKLKPKVKSLPGDIPVCVSFVRVGPLSDCCAASIMLVLRFKMCGRQHVTSFHSHASNLRYHARRLDYPWEGKSVSFLRDPIPQLTLRHSHAYQLSTPPGIVRDIPLLNCIFLRDIEEHDRLAAQSGSR